MCDTKIRWRKETWKEKNKKAKNVRSSFHLACRQSHSKLLSSCKKACDNSNEFCNTLNIYYDEQSDLEQQKRSLCFIETDWSRKCLAKIEHLIDEEMKAKRAFYYSTIFHEWTEIVYRSTRVNLFFAKERIINYLYDFSSIPLDQEKFQIFCQKQIVFPKKQLFLRVNHLKHLDAEDLLNMRYALVEREKIRKT